MEYLVRKKLTKQQRKGRRAVVAHLWDGSDTACGMYSTGGMRPAAYEISNVPEGARLCCNCVAAVEGSNLSKEWQEAIWRDRGLSGSDTADMMDEKEA